MDANLSDFVARLEAAGELKRIRARVSPVLEIAAIADRASKSPAPHAPSESARRNDPRASHLGGAALLFENVEGAEMPVLINAYGSYRRMEMMLDCPDGGFDEIGARIGELVKPQPPRSFGDMLSRGRQMLPLLRTPPRRKKGRGPCQEVVETGKRIDLTRLPLIRCWPLDGDFASLGYPADVNDEIPGLGRGAEWERRFRGRYITLGGVHTIHADDRDDPRPASHNIGMYRVQLLGRDKMAMHWHMHHDGARHWRSWKSSGEPMPVAIVLGGEPVLPYAATAPLPPGLSELLLAGFLHGRGIEMVRAMTVPLWVPANAEIVIEGFVSSEAGPVDFDPRCDGAIGPGAVFEGPFGDHTGFYSLPDRYPILTVTAITRRRDPIYPTTVVGLPPQEDYFLGKATERIFLPLLRTMIPDIEDYDLPMFGAFHNCAFVKIRKQYPLHARRVMHAIWGAGQMSWTKSIFVVDHDVDVHDAVAVLSAATRNVVPARDWECVRGPLDILDHAAPHLGAGTKFGIDCTRKIEGEAVNGLGVARADGRGLAADLSDTEAVLRAARTVSGVLDAGLHADGWLIARISKTRAGQGHEAVDGVIRAMGERGIHPPPILIVVSVEADPSRLDQSLFHWLAHSDAGRDARVHRFEVGDPSCGGRSMLAFDATPKLAGDQRNGEPVRAWPPILVMDGATIERAESLRSEWHGP